jgi:hypothetical protein
MELPIFEIFLDEESTEQYAKVSVVKDPAVELKLIKFSSEDKPLFFANEEKRIIYSVAMRPNKMIYRKNVNDTVGEEQPAYVFYNEDTVRKFQEIYFKNCHNKQTNINHEEEDVQGVYPIESWIVENPEMDKSKAIGLETMKGDLVMAFKIDNDEVWEQCKNGDLDGLSIEAFFDKKSNFKTEINMSKPSKLEQATAFFKALFAEEEEKKDLEQLESEEEKVEEMEDEVPAEETNDLAEENAKLKVTISELETKIAEMEAKEIKDGAELETMKKEFSKFKKDFETFKSNSPAAQPVKNLPKENFSELSPLEKFKKQHLIR